MMFVTAIDLRQRERGINQAVECTPHPARAMHVGGGYILFADVSHDAGTG